MAMKEWRSDPRIFWFGRSTSGVSAHDLAQYADPRLKQDVVFDVTIRRGATHNLLSDLLVVTGLVGTVLVLSLWVATIFLFLRLSKICRKDSMERQLFIVSAVFAAFQLVYGLVGGAQFPMLAVMCATLGFMMFGWTEKTQNNPMVS